MSHGSGERDATATVEERTLGRSCFAQAQREREVAAQDDAPFARETLGQGRGHRADAGDRRDAERDAGHEFHTVILDHVPAMDYEQRNEAKRFIILIDTLYDNAVKLLASADAEPDALYRASDGFEAAEFSRTASRLIEMRSQAYLALPHGHAVASGSSEGLVET